MTRSVVLDDDEGQPLTTKLLHEFDQARCFTTPPVTSSSRRSLGRVAIARAISKALALTCGSGPGEDVRPVAQPYHFDVAARVRPSTRQ